MRISYSVIAAGCIAATLLIFQITPLFWNKLFYFDWVNHVWTVEYYSAYLKQHGSFPATIDVVQGFGSPRPIFYGVFFYPLLSVISIITGADLAVRLFCGFLLLAPMVSFAVLFHTFAKNIPLSILLAITVNSSVYQLTNLYARSALTEFAAFQLLMLAVSLVFYGLTQKSRIGNAALSLGVACVALSLGAHPITFYTFSIFVVPLLLFGYFSIRRVVLIAPFLRASFWGACAFFILLPWVINTFKYRGDLQISTTNALAGKLYYFPASIDSFWGRLGLFYVDPRVLTDGIDATSTPFLDAPFALGLVLILLIVFIRLVSYDKAELYKLIIPSLLCVCTIIYSVVSPDQAFPGLWPDSVFVLSENGFLYKMLMPIQFIYRLSGTFSLCMTVALLAGLSALCRSSKFENYVPSLIGIAYISAFIALIGAGQKLYVTYVEFVKYPAYRERNVSHLSPKDSDRILLMKRNAYKELIRNVNSYPVTFYGLHDFSMPRIFPLSAIADTKNRTSVSFHAMEYGKEASVVCDQPCVLQTNIVPSSFHRIIVDGFEAKDIAISGDGNMEILMDAGHHTLKMEKTGGIIRCIQASIWIMLLWFFGSLMRFYWLVIVQIIPRDWPNWFRRS